MWFLVHDIDAAKPGQVAIFLFVFLALNLQETFFCIIVFTSGCRRDTKVPVEVIIINEIRSDTLEVNEDIIKLFQDKECRSHALAPWNCIALRWRSTYHLEEILRNAHMIFLLGLLTYNRVHDSL